MRYVKILLKVDIEVIWWIYLVDMMMVMVMVTVMVEVKMKVKPRWEIRL